ncbi:DUF257 family protein [Thermococcus barophilus]|uniref:Uncharacterized protein n=1 Tax=Thermococcus barophilus TaxID=55802 RepID=A0A0S1XEL0_THEBA|nr:DUF257 family protein [Thermococcus barophilus]ALM76163.1 hypothetical protein TBCH5v1_2267 [Thermococcus barophilus]
MTEKRDVLSEILQRENSIVLVEYTSTDHPEMLFYQLLKKMKEINRIPLIVDIWNTLHIFIQNLKFSGINVNIAGIPIIKERGRLTTGSVIGSIDIIEDFLHHLAMYGDIVKNVPKNIRDQTIVLGMEKFSYIFSDNPSKLERYFEIITRRYLPIWEKVDFLFLNIDVASEYLKKCLEQDSDYVLRLRKTKIEVLKSPEVI